MENEYVIDLQKSEEKLKGTKKLRNKD
jgi:hypothetical protein